MYRVDDVIRVVQQLWHQHLQAQHYFSWANVSRWRCCLATSVTLRNCSTSSSQRRLFRVRSAGGIGLKLSHDLSVALPPPILVDSEQCLPLGGVSETFCPLRLCLLGIWIMRVEGWHCSRAPPTTNVLDVFQLSTKVVHFLATSSGQKPFLNSVVKSFSGVTIALVIQQQQKLTLYCTFKGDSSIEFRIIPYKTHLLPSIYWHIPNVKWDEHVEKTRWLPPSSQQ